MLLSANAQVHDENVIDKNKDLPRLRTPMEVDRDARRARGELEPQITMAEKRSALNLVEAEERTEEFRKSLQESRIRRQTD